MYIITLIINIKFQCLSECYITDKVMLKLKLFIFELLGNLQFCKIVDFNIQIKSKKKLLSQPKA